MYSSRAFLALLHHHRPELVDLSRMEERDTITNCTEAFAIAEVSTEQRWWAGLSVDVNFGKLGVKGKKVDMHSHLVSLVHIDCEALAFGLACNANFLPLVSVRVDFCKKNRLSLN